MWEKLADENTFLVLLKKPKTVKGCVKLVP
jgi:hypothetical protein